MTAIESPTVAEFFTDLRQREFARLDRDHVAYLDYTGSGLYATRQLQAHHAMLCDAVYGNPHSDNSPSRASTEVIDAARRAVLHFLGADPEEYVVCFTANASAAIKLVGESYPFTATSEYVLASDNHNSINGIREFASRAGARVRYVPLTGDLRLKDPRAALEAPGGAGPRLFAYPAQSNFSGVQHPLELVAVAHEHGFDVLLDAAAYVPTHRLRLRDVRADFVTVSFYKVFGYPTGIGALVGRRDAMARLRRPWFAGGTVDYVSVQNVVHRLRQAPEAFEDGTPDFLSIAALRPGFELIEEIGAERLAAHVRTLTRELLAGLEGLRHENGAAMVEIYGPRDLTKRGGTVAFNLQDRAGRLVPFAMVESRAREAGVSVRAGCFCNPGAAEAAFGYDAARVAECVRSMENAFSLERFAECLGPNVAVGAVRASVGVATNSADVARAVEVIRQVATA